jgi:hypothetical protein
MVWAAVNKEGKEAIYTSKPIRGINILENKETWLLTNIYARYAFVPKGTIKRLTGKDLTWKDEPVKI